MADDGTTDILLVTVNRAETRAVLDTFGGTDDIDPQSIGRHIYFDLGTFNNARVALTRSEMGTQSPGASLQTVSKAIAARKPSAVIMVGIAFGIDDQKQSIGDVLVTERLRLYELQRVGTGKDGKSNILLRDDKPPASQWLLNLFKSSDATWNGAPLRFGTLLTGSKLVDNIDFREQLRAFEPEAVGGEMEGAGLYVACLEEKVDWILVKAICDFADGQKSKDKEKRQRLAATNAATFVRHAIEFAPVDWRTPEIAGAPSRARPSAHTAAKARLEVLLEQSFDYCLRRKKKPDPASNTAMYFFGINFNPSKPELKLSLIVQAIGTELDHLGRVTFAGELHNPGKEAGVEQIADEIIDMWRYLLMLGIAVGVENWNDVPWLSWFLASFEQRSEMPALPHYARDLHTHYGELLQLCGDRAPPKKQALEWLAKQLEALGGLARRSGVTLEHLAHDLKQRLGEDRSSPTATTQHLRHGGPLTGAWMSFGAYIPDRPGTYRMLLRELATQGFDIWASVSRTLVWGETAEAILLIAKGGAEQSPDDEAIKLLEHLRTIKLADQSGSSVNARRLIVSSWKIHSSAFSAATEGAFIAVVAGTLQKFWSHVSAETYAASTVAR